MRYLITLIRLTQLSPMINWQSLLLEDKKPQRSTIFTTFHNNRFSTILVILNVLSWARVDFWGLQKMWKCKVCNFKEPSFSVLENVLCFPEATYLKRSCSLWVIIEKDFFWCAPLTHPSYSNWMRAERMSRAISAYRSVR